MRDFLELSYKGFNPHVVPGEKRPGEVYGFLKDSRNDEDERKYSSMIKQALEWQKFCDSKKAGYDVGMAVAAANLFNNGTYMSIVRRLRKKDNLELEKCELAVRVEENGDTYHIFLSKSTKESAEDPQNPLKDPISLKMEEQRGVIAYSVLKQLSKDPNIDKVKMRNEWPMENNSKNCLIFRNLLNNSRVYVIDGPQVYENCKIYKNVCKNIVEKFDLNKEDVEKTSPLELKLAIA